MIGSANEPTIYLDGINNVGFSGGPMSYQVMGTQDWRIAGVISGYESVEEPVKLQNQDVGLRYAANTGLIHVAPIERAVEIAKGNPIGFILVHK